MKTTQAILFLASFALATAGRSEDFDVRCADRAAIERVYHSHRLGTKPPFEEAMPRALLERLVRADLHKEAVLRKTYGVEITPAMVAAEVQRIDTTTRAPEMLAEIKHALGGDAARFARTMARPILVERELRRRFDHDDPLHAERRREAEHARESLLAKKPVEAMHDVTWQLGPHPEEENTKLQTPNAKLQTPTRSTATSGAYRVEATAQIAQELTPPAEARDRRSYFEDLDPELQMVLRAQLRKPGDVSAVIETAGGFLLFFAKEKSVETLSAASLSIPKRSYEEWLAQQPDP